MNAMLNIQVRVIGRQAQQQLNGIASSVGAVNAASGKAATGGLARFGSAMKASLGKLEKFGKNLQWVGRQLEFNFTLPIAAAGYFATKWALDNEKAMTQVRKVYGDFSFTSQRVKEETDALARSFELLSGKFGENQAEVIDVGAAWAAAGSAGVGLAKNVQNTLEAAILGDFDLDTATTSLIAIMATYGLTADEMRKQLSLMNVVENETAVRMKDLVDVLQRAGGAGRSAGVDIEHFNAMAAQMIPATGGAAAAGNALRTMISRLLSPTKAAADQLQELGINVNSLDWTSKNFTERMDELATKWKGLTASHRANISTTLASRWQINRFDILMRGFIETNSLYHKALDIQKDKTQAAITYQKELLAVLDSNPKKLEIMTNVIKNELAGAMVQLLPAIVGFIRGIALLAEKFGALDPKTQKFILAGLAIIAITGPIIRYIGATSLMVSELGKALYRTTQGFIWLAKNAATAMAYMAGLAWNFVTRMILGDSLALGSAQTTAAGRVTFNNAANATVAAGATTTAATVAGAAQAAAAAQVTAAALGAGAWVQSAELIAGAQTSAGALTAGSWVQTSQLMLGTASTTTSTAVVLWSAAAAEAAAAQIAGASASYAAWMGFVTNAGAGMMALGMASGRMAAAIAAQQIAAAGTVGSVWIGTYTSIAAAGFVAGESISALWVGSFVGIASAHTAIMELMAGQQLALAAGSGRIMAAMAAQATAAAGTVGGSWAMANATIVESTIIAGNVVASVWTGVAASTFPAAALTASTWTASAIEVAAVETAAMTVAASSQALVPMAALPAATATTSIWVRSLVAIRSALGRVFIAPIVAAAKYVAAALASSLGAIATTLSLPVWAVVAIIAAVVAAIVVLFNDDLRNGVINGLKALPQAIANVFRQVVSVISTAMRSVIEWLSYLNPFARHSPSLVDNVKAGVATILDQYSKLRHIPAVIRSAAAAHKEFLNATASGTNNFQNAEYSEQRAQIVAVAPNAGPAVDNLIANINALRSTLPPIAREIENQARVVSEWEAKLKPLEDRLRSQESVLENLEYQLSLLDDTLRVAKDSMEDFANTPITGMKAFSDAIFENEMAQKRLRLEILRLEQGGESIDELKRKYEELSGMIEKLRNTREELRRGGAGSEILSVYDAELQALEDQRDAMEGQGSEIEELTRQLEELQRTGQMLDLEQSINFDPQLRQIDEMVNGIAEMSFDDIVAGIQRQKAVVDELQPKYDAMSTKVERQRSIVEATRREHDLINDSLTIEKERLSELERAYSDIEAQIREMESAMSGFASSAQKSMDDASPEFGDFDIPGGDALLGPEGDLFDIEQFNKDLEDQLGDLLGEMDIFGPIKDAWNKTWGAIKGTASGIVNWFKRNLSFEGIGNVFGSIGDMFAAMGRVIKSTWDDYIWPVFNAIWQFVEPVLGPIFRVLQTVVETVFGAIATVISWAWETIIKPVFGYFTGFIRQFILPILSLLWTTVDIIFTGIGHIIRGAWETVIKPVFGLLVGFVRDVLGPIFSWLYHTIVRPVMQAIGRAIGWTYDNVILPIFKAIDWALKNIVAPAFTWLRDNIIRPVWDTITSIIGNAWNGIARIVETAVNFFVSIFNILARAVNSVASAIGSGSRVTEMKNVQIPRWNSGGGGSGQQRAPGAFAKGGIMTEWGNAPFTEVNNGFVTNEVRAIVGEGSRHPEYVIPTDPKHRGRALALFDQLGSELMAAGGKIPAMATGGVMEGIMRTVKALNNVHHQSIAGSIVGSAKEIFNMIDSARSGLRNLNVKMVKDTGSHVVDEVYGWAKSKMVGLGIKARDAAWDAGAIVNPVDDIINIFRATGGEVPKNPIDLATGGMVRRRTGGTLLRVGEGRHDEKVQVLPVHKSNSEGGNVLNFYGDMSFPNIKDGDDAEEFVDNLKALAG